MISRRHFLSALTVGAAAVSTRSFFDIGAAWQRHEPTGMWLPWTVLCWSDDGSDGWKPITQDGFLHRCGIGFGVYTGHQVIQYGPATILVGGLVA